ncbi:helix-turn-helix domain-containing protein [Methanobrevibacter sp.]|uniref:helix-turn-helix domain-containing protein n=1 Tax=Methanobrevibacter sp. TaxID=66852 RepID=UPI003864C4AB
MGNVSSIILVGENLKQLRVANNYTQQQIGEYLGVDQSLISKIEHGERNINMTMLEKLSLLYDILDYELLYPLKNYKAVPIQSDTIVDLNAVAKMNQVKTYLQLLRRLTQ